jgi:TRAP transporter TAXI family solute receptor
LACCASSAFLAACRKAAVEQSHPPAVIRVAADGLDTNPLIQALQGPLQSYYPSRIETVQNDLPTNARLVEEARVELAIIPLNVAYLAYKEGWGGLPRPHSKLRGIAALYTIPVYLIATESSRIHRWSDIRGKRVAIGPESSTTQATVKMTLEGLGLSLADIDAHLVNGDAAVMALRAAEVDAVFHRGIDPPSTIPKLLRIPRVKVIPISPQEREGIRARHPFLHPVITPAGMYGNHPEVETLGVDCMVVCREDVPEDLVYAVARSVFESLDGSHNLAKSNTASFLPVDLRQIHATQIPLHPGAAKYFRERELFQ